MAEVDTSSYPKAGPPVSLLDNVQKLGNLQQQQQQIQSGALTIDKQKLDLVNQRFGEMAKGFTKLIADNADPDQYREYVQNQVKLGYVPPEMAAQTLSTFPNTQGLDDLQTKAAMKQWGITHLQHAQSTLEAINNIHGQNATQSDQANTYTGVQRSPMMGGGFRAVTKTPIQLPPTQPVIGQNLAPGVAGPSGPPGPRPYIAGPNGSPTPSPQLAPVTGLRSVVQQPSVSGPTGPTVNRGTEFNDRFSAAFPNAIATGASPGQQSAMEAVGAQSGKDYATDLTRTKHLNEDLYPAQKVLELVKEEGSKAFGPGTDSLNAAKSLISTWLPNVDPKIVESTSNYEQVKKYLTQIARTSGNTGTNDQLASAFEANPSVKMQSATIENVVKSIVALRKMDAAKTLMFGKTGLPDDQYSKWAASNQNVLDARAFGFDMMDQKAKEKLITTLKKDPKAFKKFEGSLQFAHDAELITPPSK